MYKRENAVTWYANYAPTGLPVTVTESLTVTLTARPGVATGNGSIHKLLLYYRPHNMGLRLRQKSLYLAYVLAPLCAISNFNYEQVNTRNFPAAMLLHGRLSFRKPVLPSPSSGLVHRAFPKKIRECTVKKESARWRSQYGLPETELPMQQHGSRKVPRINLLIIKV